MYCDISLLLFASVDTGCFSWGHWLAIHLSVSSLIRCPFLHIPSVCISIHPLRLPMSPRQLPLGFQPSPQAMYSLPVALPFWLAASPTLLWCTLDMALGGGAGGGGGGEGTSRLVSLPPPPHDNRIWQNVPRGKKIFWTCITRGAMSCYHVLCTEVRVGVGAGAVLTDCVCLLITHPPTYAQQFLALVRHSASHVSYICNTISTWATLAFPNGNWLITATLYILYTHCQNTGVSQLLIWCAWSWLRAA